MSMDYAPWIGSLGITKDIRAALQTSCQMAPGHEWDPSEAIDWWPEGELVAAHPKCRECVAQMKARLLARGLTEEQMVRTLRRLGCSISVRKDSERKVFGEEDTIMLGGRYTDWLRGLPPLPYQEPQKEAREVSPAGSSYREPTRKLGDSIEWVDEMTEEMVQSNLLLEIETDETLIQRAEFIEAGGELMEAMQRFPLPETKKFVLVADRG